MKVDVLLGLQWGDEGKGKIVDVLTPKYNVVARFQGGPNAGHTLEFDGRKHVLHTIPSGVFHPHTINIVGNGVVIDPIIFQKEIAGIITHGVDIHKNLFISRKAHLILPTHRLLDAASEASKGKKKVGSTLKGIGPAYMDKTGRNGLRVGDIESANFKEKYDNLVAKHKQLLTLYDYDAESNFAELESEWMESIKQLNVFKKIDSEIELYKYMKEGKKILAEGAQGTLLDIDFGTYPFVTSSNTVCAGACTGLGVAPTQVGDVYGIFKAYVTRVGSGPFPTELSDETGAYLQKAGNEFGSTTGRARRCGWLDIPALKYAVRINGVNRLIMMKADVLSGLDSIKVCTHYNYKGTTIDHVPYDISPDLLTPIYKDLSGWKQDLTGIDSYDNTPIGLKAYVKYIESEVEVPITIVSVGPDRKQTLIREL